MSIQDVTDSVEPILKQFYSNEYDDLAYRDHPVMALVSKKNGAGETVKQAIKTAYTAGIGKTFSTAQANASDESRYAFLLTNSYAYAIQSVLNTDIELASQDVGAIRTLMADSMESCMRACSNQLEFALYGDGFGTLATITANSGAGPYVLTVGSAAVSAGLFFPNQVLVSSAANNSASLDTGTALVTATDSDAGTVTVTAQSSWTPTNTHVLFDQANKVSGAYSTKQLIAGLSGWLPLAAPTSGDSFYGVDRSVNPTALAGYRLDCRSYSTVQSAIQALANRIATTSQARPDRALVSFNTYNTLQLQLDAKARYVDVQGRQAKVFFSGVEIIGPKGPIQVVASPYMTDDRFYVLQSDTWTLYSPGNEPVKTANRNKFVDVYNKDAIEFRFRYQVWFGCAAPGYNGVGQLA